MFDNMSNDEIAVYYTAIAQPGMTASMAASVADGLNEGRDEYGVLVLANDNRDFWGETDQELRDAVVYMSAEIVRADSARARHMLAEVVKIWNRLRRYRGKKVA